MKLAFLLIAFLFVSIFGACGQDGSAGLKHTRTLTGYPVYQFVNFSGINQKVLDENEEAFREALGEYYDSYVKHHEAMVLAGFDKHDALRVIGHDAKEIEIYILNSDYMKLWIIDPYDLRKQGKSHHVTIEYEAVEVGDQVLNRAKSFEAKLVSHKPTIRK